VTVGKQFTYPDSVTLRPFSAITRLCACKGGRIPSSFVLARYVPQLVFILLYRAGSDFRYIQSAGGFRVKHCAGY
jgi:hypothetical protein